MARTAVAGLAIILLINGSVQPRVFSMGKSSHKNAARGEHLNPTSTIGDLLRHPAFEGFAPLILPWDDRTYDEQMPLARIGSLLPYHTNVDPHTVADALNRLIDEAASGKTVFYRFYSDTQIRQEPDRANTGLFFVHGRPGAPFALIAPGGGFSYVASVHEGFPYAVAIGTKGYNAFVLRYRTGQGATLATQDMAAALTYILGNATTLDVGTRDYSLWGSSAGARMAASIGSYGAASYGGEKAPKPSTVVMAYTGHSDYTSAEPPTFVAVGSEDRIAPAAVMERRVEALRKSGTKVEYQEYKGLGHGFGLGAGTSAEGWVLDAIRFWERSMPSRPWASDEGVRAPR